jgi:hypothetical protein
LRFSAHKGEPAFFEQLCDATLALPGVTKVEARPATGSVIISHDGPLAPLAEAARTAGAFLVAGTDDGPAAESWSAEVQRLFSGLLPPMSDNTATARSGAAVVLLAMAAIQASRGHVMPPATTSLWYAISLLAGGGPGADADSGGEGE